MEEKKGKLQESGAEEIEVMGFTIAGEFFGVNASVVQEIMISRDVDSIPHTHRSVEGAFKLRNSIVTVINLPQYLNLEGHQDKERELFIVTSSDTNNIAFRVHNVLGLVRIASQSIKKPDKFIYGGSPSVVTGIVDYKGKLLNILDFDKVAQDVSTENSLSLAQLEVMASRKEDNRQILIAEDSIYLTKLITKNLAIARYTNMHKVDNGQELWDYLQKIKDVPDLVEKLGCIITGIDMPEMDGHRLTELVKNDPKLKEIPVIIFTNQLTDKIRAKGKSLGADEQLTSQEVGNLVSTVDSLTANSKK